MFMPVPSFLGWLGRAGPGHALPRLPAPRGPGLWGAGYQGHEVRPRLDGKFRTGPPFWPVFHAGTILLVVGVLAEECVSWNLGC